MFPFTRPNERGRDKGNWSWGVTVRAPDGARYFFPGAEPDLAMILARESVPAAVLSDPKTQIEFGERTDGAWVSSNVLKEAIPDGANT